MQSAVFCRDGTVFVPVEDVMSSLRMGYYTDAETKTIYITRGACEDRIPADVNVPILMYHAVSDDLWGSAELFVSPAEMEKQLAYLQENGYTTITFEDLPRLDEIEKPILLTFDDGYRITILSFSRFYRNMRRKQRFLSLRMPLAMIFI